MHHILHTFSDEDADKIDIITAGTRKDNVASATARRASRKASNPPGCKILIKEELKQKKNIELQINSTPYVPKRERDSGE